MSNITKVTVVMAALLAAPSSAFAKWSSWFPVRDILVHDDSLEVTLEGSQSCSLTFRLSSSTPNYEVKASALLAAYYSGHEVSVDFTGTTGTCTTPMTRLKVRR